MSSSTTTTTTTIGKSDHETPEFDTTANNLQDLLEYNDHASGRGLYSLVSLPAGSLFAPLTAISPCPAPLWHTLQISRTEHVNLDSAFKYLNHSCNPSLEIDTEKREVRVAKDRDLNKGDLCSFFYPSTEWSMDRGFDCLCGEKQCVGQVRGAKDMKKQDLEKWFINGYIWELKDEQEKEGKSA